MDLPRRGGERKGRCGGKEEYHTVAESQRAILRRVTKPLAHAISLSTCTLLIQKHVVAA